MPFPCMQKYRSAACTAVFEVEDRTLESGEVVHESVDQSKKVLPEPELFDLKNQLKAGINLEEVSSKVLGTKSIDGDKVIEKIVKRGRGRPKKTEVTNEG